MAQRYVSLVRAYASNLKPYMDTAIESLCYGCAVDHPSQIQHDVCVMMEKEQRTQHCIVLAAELLYESTGDWRFWKEELEINKTFKEDVVFALLSMN